MSKYGSKKITDYFEAKTEVLRPEEKLPFSAYLYFPGNDHVLMWLRSGETPTALELKRYLDRGLKQIWIFNEDKAAFEIYLNPPKKETKPAPAAEKAKPPAAAKTEPPPVPKPPVTEEGKKIVEAMNNPTTPEKKSQAQVAKEARSVLAEIGAAEKSIEEHKKVMEKAKQVLDDVLQNTIANTKTLLNDVWKTAKIDPEFQHAVNVATYSSLIAMASGRAEPEIVADIALAALLHDLGMSQVPAEVARISWKELDEKSKPIYETHVQRGLQLLTEFSPDISNRAKAIIFQHHEKFDGTGYPSRFEGFKVNDLAQLISVADLLDSVTNGRYDGKVRTLSDTFDTLEKVEKSRTFPEYFNPEIFSLVVKWFKSAQINQFSGKADEIVGAQTSKLLGAEVDKKEKAA